MRSEKKNNGRQKKAPVFFSNGRLQRNPKKMAAPCRECPTYASAECRAVVGGSTEWMAPTPEVASIVRRISLFMKPKYQFSGIVPTRYSSQVVNGVKFKIEVRADDLLLTFEVQRLTTSATMQIRRGASWVPLPELPSSSCYGAREGAASDTCFTCADVIASYKAKGMAYKRKDFMQCNPTARAYAPRTTAPGSTPAPAAGTLTLTPAPASTTAQASATAQAPCPARCAQAKGANPNCGRWLSPFDYCGDEATFGKGFNDAGTMVDCTKCTPSSFSTSTPAQAQAGTLTPGPAAARTLTPAPAAALPCPVTCGQAKDANPKCSRWLSTFGYCGDEATFGKGFNDAGLMADCRKCT